MVSEVFVWEVTADFMEHLFVFISLFGWGESVSANTASNGPIASPSRMAAKMICSVGERTRGSGRTVTITCSGHILCMWTALAMNCGLRAEDTNLLQS